MKTEHLVTAIGSSASQPYLVASKSIQYGGLVDLALRDPGYTGIDARTHSTASFHVGPTTDRRAVRQGTTTVPPGWILRQVWGVLFYDDPRPAGDNSPIDDGCAWLVLPSEPTADAPTVYFDQPSKVQFPPRCVMPIDELRDVVLQFISTGERPTSMDWLTVNSLHWTLDGAGDVVSN